MNAAGGFIPPMFIHRTSPTLEKDGHPGALYKCSKNGWTNVDLFMPWLQHFFDHVKPNPQKPVLLVLDNNYSHITHGNRINSVNKTAHSLSPYHLTHHIVSNP
jgi:hypothetical protein